MKKFILFLFVSALVLIGGVTLNRARAADGVETSSPTQPRSFEGQVTGILEEEDSYQKLEVWLTAGEQDHKTVTVEVGGDIQRIGEAHYQIGDRVVLSSILDTTGNEIFYVTDFVRRGPLLWLFLIFVLLTA
ncbi:hypothetical protein L6258_02380, partial [Candidatus Parcubacteria bacterium]|nr:hypothetical protein [Candidatus Parcubacteria bacterium]